ncbi:MAG: single-stranded-DNA-specific exonuclease RecJ [Desulfobulbaceae bacterium]|nr:single-stranded-DNA-specific exonuclease RecJ [Desulfobulbaceae bacterium]
MPNRSTNTKWEIIYSPGDPSDSSVHPPAIPAPILAILANRGIIDAEEVQRFLYPSLDQLPSPHLLLGLDQAVTILVEARLRRIPVLIHGDYDADGVTATALLVKFFREIDLPVFYFIPDRINDGYGLNCDTLGMLRNRSGIVEHATPILLTVDCGITSVSEIAAAKSLGFRVIITDHHLPALELPEADAIINPHQPGCSFPFRELSGVGVAFYLAAGLRMELVKRGAWLDGSLPNLKKYLDLVAIGSVADMVPLRGVNRILVKAGLEVINQNPGPGITALLAQINQKVGKTTAETIAFYLAPRLNAVGRIGSAEVALWLLLADDEVLAGKLADALGRANQARKDMSDIIFSEACSQVESQIAEDDLALVVAGEGWHPGIVGLVASRLAREYSRPAVVFSLDGLGAARGSIRSVGDLDIFRCLQDCAGIIEKFGGHRQAAGLTIKIENLTEFKVEFAASVGKAINLTDMESRLEIDMAADPSEIMSDDILKYLLLLEPCGVGNPGPIFCFHPKGIKLVGVQKIGVGSMRFRVATNGREVKGVAFGRAEWISLAEKLPVRLAYKVYQSEYRGEVQWEIQAEDIKEVV